MRVDTLYIVMPAYNEAANIEEVVAGWYPIVERAGGDSRLVVLDDGSRDGTGGILAELARTRPRLVALSRANRGHGATVLELYRYALANGADYVFQTDSDGQTDPAEFDALWRLRDACDMAMGVRVARGDGASRVVVTRVLKAVVRAAFHVRLADANVPFRLMSAPSLARCLAHVPAGHNLSNVLIAVVYRKLGLAIEERPISFKARGGGENSIDLASITGIGARALADFHRLNRRIDGEIERERLGTGARR